MPSIFISTANGVLFGIGPGILISWLAECTGVIIGFILMRSILRHSAELLINKSPYLKKVDEFSSHNGFKMMLFARSLPYFPSGVITAVGAISSISLYDYVLATLIGKFPSTALEVIVGHDIVNITAHYLLRSLPLRTARISWDNGGAQELKTIKTKMTFITNTFTPRAACVIF